MLQLHGIGLLDPILLVATAIIISSSLALAFSASGLRPCGSSEDGESYVVEWSNDESDYAATNIKQHHRFNAKVFASSNCWGRRPFLLRRAFDPNLLLDRCSGENDDDGSEETIFAWPSWDEVVEIASDDDSESR